MVKLFEIEKGSKIYCEVSDGSKFIIYHHPDGIYSYCKTEKGAVVHLGLMQPLQKFRDGYKIAKKRKLDNITLA